MAVLSSRLRRQEPEAPPTPPLPLRKALVAAASSIALDGTSWKSFKLGDTAWQGEGWNHYDICGELRFVANWIGSSVSRCRLYIAKLDAAGKPGEEVTDPDIAVLAETVFGGPAKKAEAMRLLGTHLYVPGESYIVAEGVENANEDRWYVVSTSGIKRQGDREIMVERPQEYGGGWYTLKEGQDLLIRVWTPHPRKPDLADSSVRPALPILREIEQLTKHIFAQIDSRLAGAGLLLLPDQLDFPRGEDDPAGAEGLMKVLQRAMAAALADRADPSSLVPIMAQVPGEFIDKVRHVTFETPLAQQGMEIRDRAIRRLGLSLDVDPEILLGKGDTNHWSAWQLEETTIKVHIEPLLARICDALTTGYLRAALTAMGKDPDEYTYWYDPSPLAVRPDRQNDAVELHDKEVLSDEALRAAGSWSEEDAPDDEERARRLAVKLVLASPDLIREKAIREALGVSWEIEPAQQPPALAAGPNDQPPPDQQQADQRPAKDPANTRERSLPSRPQQGDQGAAQAALLMGAHMVVQRSLELAGKRLLTRANRDKYRDVPPWELHTAIHVLEADHADRLLDDTFASVPMLAERTGVPNGWLRDKLATYCRELFVRAVPHDPDALEAYLLHDLPEAQFHLPGLHDQRNHGRRKGRPGFEPLTPGEKSTRASERRAGRDPDRDAPAPSRQGRRAMAMWEAYAAKLGLPEAERSLTPRQQAALDRAALLAAELERDVRKAKKERAREGTTVNAAITDPVRKKIPEGMDVQADLKASLGTSDRAAQARIEAAMRAAYEIEDPETGIKVEVEAVRFPQSGAHMQLVLKDRNGRQVGTCTRRWVVRNIGEAGEWPPRQGIRVEHAYLSLRPGARGGGFAKRFNANAEEVYKEAGVDAIEIHANIDVGGYAWAKQGYLFAGFSYANTLATSLDYRANALITDPADREAWNTLRGRMTEANFKAGTAPTPMEFAMFGWKPGAETWLGKRMMLNSDWYGLKPMRQDAVSLVAAASHGQVLMAQYSEDLDLWHTAWTERYADEVPYVARDRTPNANGESDYPEHHHDVSANAEEDDVFWTGALALLAGESLGEGQATFSLLMDEAGLDG